MYSPQKITAIALASLLLCLLSFTSVAISGDVAPPIAAPAWKAKNVVILVMDGARWTETWGDPERKNIPEIAAKLAPRGVVCTNAWNEGRTETIPGHAALVTGFYDPLDNDGSELPTHPTILQRFVRTSGLPSEKVWLVSGKDKLHILGDCKEDGWRGKFAPARHCGKGGRGPGSGYDNDAGVAAKIKEVLVKNHPRLLVANFPSVDGAGHRGPMDAYVKAIQEADHHIAAIFATLETDPFYRDQTAVFVVNDHGRHSNNFREHGWCDCEGCRHILLLAAGPDFKQGAVAKDKAGLVDVAVTAAAILGIEIPGAQGKVMKFLRADATDPQPGGETKQFKRGVSAGRAPSIFGLHNSTAMSGGISHRVHSQ
jgi:hypothetical protein